MKKIIILMCLLLVGCDTSNDLTNTCIKEEKANNFTYTQTYTITFLKDVVSAIKVEEKYIDDNNESISSVKLSKETQHKYWKNKTGLLINTLEEENKLTIVYDIDINKIEEDMKEEFVILDSRAKMINKLKEQGFTCK